MSIRVRKGILRELAESLGRFFERREIEVAIDELDRLTLCITLMSDQCWPSKLTVEFDMRAMDAFSLLDIGEQRNALSQIYEDFSKAMLAAQAQRATIPRTWRIEMSEPS